MPTLNWIGKEAVVNHEKQVPFRLLKKVKSISVGENSQNLIIHGDNLEALKALMPYYVGKIKCIYIDPPYNTGNEGWVYNDNVNSPKIKKWLGKVVGGESEDLCRHDKWLCMMYPRLRLLRELMADDGIIFISIDDNEFSRLKLLCDELFGENNLIDTFYIQVRYAEKSLNEKDDFQKLVEQVLIYAKNKKRFRPNKPVEEYSLEKFCFKITEKAEGKKTELGGKEVTIFKPGEYEIEQKSEGNINLLKATWASGSVLKGNTSGKFFHNHLENRKDIDGLNVLYKVRGIGEDGLGYRYFTGPKKLKTTKGLFYSGVPLDRREDLLKGKKSLKEKPIINFYDYSPDFGNITHEGGVGFRTGKKPVKMLKNLINLHLDKGAIVLDSFAGSGSTGHAVMQLNKEDGGNRRFILVEMEENIARDITAERIKRTIEKEGYKDGFEFCELDKPLFNEEGQIEESCSFDQLATYIYFTETQTNIDKRAIDTHKIGEFNDTAYYLIFKEKGKNVLNKEFLSKIKGDGQKKVIYADRCLLDDDVLAKHNIQFKQIPYEVKVY
jgi:adenine-specific DNA-methyltransferase